VVTPYPANSSGCRFAFTLPGFNHPNLTPEPAMEYMPLLEFWFHDQHRPLWFSRNDDFDAQCKHRFYPLWQAACRGELFHWRDRPQGRLAEIVLLDQLSRNLNRNDARAWQQDGMALILSQELVYQPMWNDLNSNEQGVSLLPMMHAESRVIHQEAERLFTALNEPGFLNAEIKHRAIIERFGRYPHRNSLLGRNSTPDEVEWLKHNKGF